MTIINITHFIKTGTFGGVRIGMTEAEVIGCLGSPEWRSDAEDAFMLSYRRWEIHFLKSNSNKVHLIQNDHLLYDCINHDEMLQFQNNRFKIELDFIRPFAYIRLREVMIWLEREKVSFSLTEDKDYEPLLKLESGVYLDFTDTEPILPKGSGVRWGPGRQQDLQENEIRIENSENLILYAIGISNL